MNWKFAAFAHSSTWFRCKFCLHQTSFPIEQISMAMFINETNSLSLQINETWESERMAWVVSMFLESPRPISTSHILQCGKAAFLLGILSAKLRIQYELFILQRLHHHMDSTYLGSSRKLYYRGDNKLVFCIDFFHAQIFRGTNVYSIHLRLLKLYSMQ